MIGWLGAVWHSHSVGMCGYAVNSANGIVVLRLKGNLEDAKAFWKPSSGLRELGTGILRWTTHQVASC